MKNRPGLKFIAAIICSILLIMGSLVPVMASTTYTSDEAIEEYRDIMAQVCMSEAGNQPMVGKVAVLVTILNRADIYMRDIGTVVTEADQYSLAYTGVPSDDCYKAVNLAVESRNLFPSNMTCFRADYFHEFGTPYIQIGDHFFSTIDYDHENDESSERISKLPRETAESLEHMDSDEEEGQTAESAPKEKKISLMDSLSGLGSLFAPKSNKSAPSKPSTQIRIMSPRG